MNSEEDKKREDELDLWKERIPMSFSLFKERTNEIILKGRRVEGVRSLISCESLGTRRNDIGSEKAE